MEFHFWLWKINSWQPSSFYINTTSFLSITFNYIVFQWTFIFLKMKVNATKTCLARRKHPCTQYITHALTVNCTRAVKLLLWVQHKSSSPRKCLFSFLARKHVYCLGIVETEISEFDSRLSCCWCYCQHETFEKVCRFMYNTMYKLKGNIATKLNYIT